MKKRPNMLGDYCWTKHECCSRAAVPNSIKAAGRISFTIFFKVRIQEYVQYIKTCEFRIVIDNVALRLSFFHFIISYFIGESESLRILSLRLNYNG